MPRFRCLLRLAALALAALLLLAPGPALAAGDWAWPVHGRVITPYRNGDDPYAGGQHRGIDIAAPVGTAVGAATGGSVSFAGNVANSGLTVTVRTSDGRYDTSYLHLSSLAVRAGTRVDQGDRVGAVGTTGRRSAVEPHLHFGVRDAGSRHAYHDPLDFLAPPPASPQPRAPAPVPVPVPAPLHPAPARGPGPARARRAPGPARRPAGRRVPAPGRVPRGLPAGAHRPLTAPAPAPAQVRSPARRARPPHRQPASLGAAPHVEPAPAAGAARGRAPTPTPAPPSRSGGPDLGWALACVGLLLAAALVGGTEEGRAAATRGRARVAAALRPLFGRG